MSIISTSQLSIQARSKLSGKIRQYLSENKLGRVNTSTPLDLVSICCNVLKKDIQHIINHNCACNKTHKGYKDGAYRKWILFQKEVLKLLASSPEHLVRVWSVTGDEISLRKGELDLLRDCFDKDVDDMLDVEEVLKQLCDVLEQRDKEVAFVVLVESLVIGINEFSKTHKMNGKVCFDVTAVKFAKNHCGDIIRESIKIDLCRHNRLSRVKEMSRRRTVNKKRNVLNTANVAAENVNANVAAENVNANVAAENVNANVAAEKYESVNDIEDVSVLEFLMWQNWQYNLEYHFNSPNNV
eukprot:300513_1